MESLVAAIRAAPSSTEASSAVLLPLLRQVNTQHAGSFAGEVRAALAKDDQKALLQFGVDALTQPGKDSGGVAEWLTLMKIVARTQTDLDALYSRQFILFLTANISQYADAAGSPSAASSLAILSASLRLLMNLCIVAKERVHQALGATSGKNAPMFGRAAEKKTESDESQATAAAASVTADTYPGFLPFLAAYSRTLNSSTEPDALFFFTRILMFILVNAELARAATQLGRLYEMLVGKLLEVTSNERLGIVLRDQPAVTATTSASASSSDSHIDSPVQNMKLCVEILKLLANTSMLDEEVPTCQAHFTGASAASSASSTSSTVTDAAASSSSNVALYNAYVARLAALLAYGVVVPAEALPGYAGDPIANASVGKLLPTSQAAAAAASGGDQAAVALEQVRLDESTADGGAVVRPATPTSVGGASASQSSASPAAAGASSSAVQFQTAPAVPSATYTPVQREQTRAILEQMAAEADDEFRQLFAEARKDASNLFLGADGHAAIGLLERDQCVAFHGLIQVLHRSLILAGKNRKDGELLLAPILSTLSTLIQSSSVLRRHAKRCLFLDLSDPPSSGADGSAYKKVDASNYAMTPAGAVSEKIVDPDSLSLKSLILQWIITLNFSLKQNVSEFLYRVCDEDTSEYIRLLGFGNAIGLLAEKGLPGFANMLQSKPIDMDAVLKSGKKL